MDIELPTNELHHCQTIENSDICGYKQQTSPNGDIELPLKACHHCQTFENPDVCVCVHRSDTIVKSMEILMYVDISNGLISKWA